MQGNLLALASEIFVKQGDHRTMPSRLFPSGARRILDKLAFYYTPKHGSWLNMAEIELSVLTRQCLERRIAEKAVLKQEVVTWE